MNQGGLATIRGGSGSGTGSGGNVRISTGYDTTRSFKVGDLVVFRPPLPRCHYQGGVYLGSEGPGCKRHEACNCGRGVRALVRLPSGLKIAVSHSRIKKAGWLESLALQAD